MLKILNFLKQENLYRKLVGVDFVGGVVVQKGGKKLLCFSSNDYLGLANNFFVKLSAIWALMRFGASARGSRYVCGNNSLYKKLEAQIAKINNCEDAIVFSSGYQVAIGVIPALVGEGDLVVADKLIHSCLLDGVKLSGAKLMRFKHNDLRHAREVISGNTKNILRDTSRAPHCGDPRKILIITEEIFSMDGDRGDVEGLRALAQEFGAILLVDAAHSLYDEDNVGATREPPANIQDLASEQASRDLSLQIHMGTLSKAIGSFGGYVAADKITIDYLRNFAKSQIYTTALPPSVLAASLQSLKIISHKNLAKKTLANARYFCELMNLPEPQSAIIVIEIGDNKKVLEVANKVEENGFLISAIRPPTTPTARLRIAFSAKHTKKQIAKLAKILQNILKTYDKSI